MHVGLLGIIKAMILSKMAQVVEKHDAISNFFEAGTNSLLAHFRYGDFDFTCQLATTGNRGCALTPNRK